MISVALSLIFLTKVLTFTTFPELRIIAWTTFVRIGNLGLPIVNEVFKLFCSKACL